VIDLYYMDDKTLFIKSVGMFLESIRFVWEYIVEYGMLVLILSCYLKNGGWHEKAFWEVMNGKDWIRLSCASIYVLIFKR